MSASASKPRSLADFHFPAQYGEVFEAMVVQAGGSVQQFYARVQLSRAALELPGASINGEQLQQMLRQCRELADPSRPTSAQLLEHFPLTAHGNLGIVILTSPNLSAALAAALRFYPVVMPAYDISREDLGDQVNLLFKPLVDFGDVSDLLAETMLGAFNSIRRFLKPDIPMLEIHLQHSNRFPLEAYSSFADPNNLRFGAPSNRILISKKYLQESLLTSNRSTMQQFEQQLEQQIAALRRQLSFTQTLKEQIDQALRGGRSLHVEDIAQSLHLSSRTLGRRLQQEGSSFKDLLNAARLDYAEFLLLNSNKSIAQVGFAAGFSNDSSFARAFRRGKGLSPTQLRAQRLQGHD